jgi:hypothetical protein
MSTAKAMIERVADGEDPTSLFENDEINVIKGRVANQQAIRPLMKVLEDAKAGAGRELKRYANVSKVPTWCLSRCPCSASRFFTAVPGCSTQELLG